MSEDYEVGFRKPPREHRFKPGRSGNPRGRPKGTRNLAVVVADVLGTRVRVKDAGRSRKVTIIEAAVMRLAQKALEVGDVRAILTLLELARAYDSGAPQGTLAQGDADIIQAYLSRLKEGC